MPDLFDNNPDPTPAPEKLDLPDSSYFDALVGDGKKFISPEDLARGKYESDLYITQLQSENAGMRAQLQEQESVSQLLDKALEKPAVAPEPTTPVENSDPAAQGITQEDIQKLVETQVNSRLNAQEKMENIQSCHDAAKALYGEDYANVLTKKAETLGLGQEFLKGIAADQPAAFLKLMVEETGEPVLPSEGVAPPPDTVPVSSQMSSVPSASVKNHAFYNELKKKDKVNYWSPAVQNEIYAAAKEQGEDFYK